MGKEEQIWLEGKKGYIKLNGKTEQILPEKLLIPGEHNRRNMLIAAATMYLYGFKSTDIMNALADFRGIPHRLEFVREFNGRKFYNDTTATIPQASLAAVKSFETPVVLIAGGTDKNLMFDLLPEIARAAKKMYLLKGSATDKMISELDAHRCQYNGPYSTLAEALDAAYKGSEKGDVVLFSPGATSFELFKNEFDRGNSFKELVLQIK